MAGNAHGNDQFILQGGFIMILWQLLSAVVALLGFVLAKKGIPPGKPLMIAGLILMIIFSARSLWIRDPDGIKQMQETYQDEGVLLGQFLSNTHGNSRALVLTRPGIDEVPYHQIEKGLFKGIRKGGGRNLDVVDVVPLPYPPQQKTREDPSGRLWMDYNQWLTPQLMMEFIEANRDRFDLLICTMDLPGRLLSLSEDERQNLPPIYMVSRMPVPPLPLLDAGIIRGFLATELPAEFSDPNPDPIIVTLEKLEQQKQAHPIYFGLPPQ
jgi:hypothetical protein